MPPSRCKRRQTARRAIDPASPPQRVAAAEVEDRGTAAAPALAAAREPVRAPAPAMAQATAAAPRALSRRATRRALKRITLRRRGAKAGKGPSWWKSPWTRKAGRSLRASIRAPASGRSTAPRSTISSGAAAFIPRAAARRASRPRSKFPWCFVWPTIKRVNRRATENRLINARTDARERGEKPLLPRNCKGDESRTMPLSRAESRDGKARRVDGDRSNRSQIQGARERPAQAYNF